MKRQSTDAAEALAIALDLAAQGHDIDDPRVRLAARLGSTPTQRETARERAKDRMLRAFDAAGGEGTEDAGTRDLPDYDVHTTQVNLAGGGHVILADVERVDEVAAARIAQELTERHAVKRERQN